MAGGGQVQGNGTMNVSNPNGNLFGAPNAGGQTGGGQTGGGQPNVFQQANNSLTGAINGTRDAMNYNPMMVDTHGAGRAATYDPRGAGRASTLGGTNLNQYMNPYQQSVINTTMNGINQDQMMAQNNLDAQASAAGGFGGSRHGVAMGTQAGEYADTKAGTLAGLNSANFQQAQQGAMFDAGQRNQNDQFNANAYNQAGQFNAGARNSVRQFNANAYNQGELANQNAGLAGAGLNLSAASQLGNLSNLGFGQGMQINGMQGAQGAQQQALQQQIMQAAMQQFGGFTGAPGQSAAMIAGGAGSVPYGTNGTQTTTQTPGLFDWLSLGASF